MTVVINGTTGVSGVAGSASTPALIGSDADSGYYINSANEPNASVNGTAVWNAASTFGFKNRIINGAMVIDQRNAGASVTPADAAYTLDRWRFSTSQASKFTVQQSTTAPAGFKNSMLITVASAVSPSAGDAFGIFQPIEGLNFFDMSFGSASAQTISISFWARSSLTGTFSGMLFNSAANRTYCFTYTINSANTFEYKTVTVAGDTTGTWLTDNGSGLSLYFDLGSGSNAAGTAGVWSSSVVRRTSGSVQLVATAGATLYITGVQLEKGSTATSFDFRSYGTELILCQRYYERFTGISSGPYRTGYGYNTAIYMSLPFQVTKRTTGGTFSSSASGTTLLSAYGNGSSSGFLGGLMTGSITFNTPELTTMTMYQNLTASTYSPYGTAILWTLNNNQWVDYSAEL